MTKEELFREAITENEDRIFRICRYYFAGEDDRDDAVQESLIRIWQNIGSFNHNSRISTWIYRVVVNTCLAGLRTNKKRNALIDDSKTLEEIHIQDSTNAEEDLEATRKLAFFQRFMKEISSVDRMLVSLYLEELSTKEMADITGLSESNVRVKIHRIKEQITKEWREKEHGIG